MLYTYRYSRIFVWLLITVFVITSCREQQQNEYTSWPQYKGSNENIHFSALTEVDTNNVKQLQVAWEYHTGDADTANHSQIQCNPIIVDGVMLACLPV
jgi:quinoprotein glucose dehydrogenase